MRVAKKHKITESEDQYNFLWFSVIQCMLKKLGYVNQFRFKVHDRLRHHHVCKGTKVGTMANLSWKQ